jgi:hypothetical protein
LLIFPSSALLQSFGNAPGSLVYHLHAEVKFLNNAQLMYDSSGRKYQLYWKDCTGFTQRRSFYTFRQMRSFEKSQCGGFREKLRYAFWTGKKFEPFVIGKPGIVFRCELLSMLERITEI